MRFVFVDRLVSAEPRHHIERKAPVAGQHLRTAVGGGGAGRAGRRVPEAEVAVGRLGGEDGSVRGEAHW